MSTTPSYRWYHGEEKVHCSVLHNSGFPHCHTFTSHPPHPRPWSLVESPQVPLELCLCRCPLEQTGSSNSPTVPKIHGRRRKPLALGCKPSLCTYGRSPGYPKVGAQGQAQDVPASHGEGSPEQTAPAGDLCLYSQERRCVPMPWARLGSELGQGSLHASGPSVA